MTALVDQLVESVTRGTVMDLADAPDRTIPAGIIRDVLRGKLAPTRILAASACAAPPGAR